ncbi:MAG: RNA polymerase factor sigma-32 [Myxococcales bacterium]|nr:RNA polymerase factor sigma-32 [Myxococcales bacterium]
MVQATKNGAESVKKQNRTALPVPQRSAALTHLDPLQRYLSEVGQFGLLSPEEEHRLAVEFQRTQDPGVAYQLVTANLRLVVKIAMEHRSYYQNVLDLIQEGNIGLMQAVKHFDPYRGVRLPSYAQWWIRAYIYKFILENFSLVKIGTTQAQRKLFFRLKKEQNRLLREGFTPDSRLLAERIDVSEKDVVEMQKRLAGPESSLQAENPSTGHTLEDILAGPGDSPETLVADEDLRRRVRAVMNEFRATLDERERLIWDARFSDEDTQTFQTIGESAGITRQRVQQLDQRLRERFRAFLLERIPEASGRLI